MLLLVKSLDAVASVFVLTEVVLILGGVELGCFVPSTVGSIALQLVHWVLRYVSYDIPMCLIGVESAHPRRLRPRRFPWQQLRWARCTSSWSGIVSV